MFRNFRSSDRRHMRPVLHALEVRTLMSGMMPDLPRGMASSVRSFRRKAQASGAADRSQSSRNAVLKAHDDSG